MDTKSRKKCAGVITHPQPHPDEIVCLWFCLLGLAEKHFPGASEIVRTGRVVFTRPEVRNGEVVFAKPSGGWVKAEQLEEEGWLLFGVGGGLFDEHQTPRGPRKEDSSAVLFAKKIEVVDNPELRQILNWVNNNDLKGTNTPDGLASIIRRGFAQDPNPWVTIMDAFRVLNTWISEQKEFCLAESDFELSTKTTVVCGGQELKLILGQPRNENFATYCRSEFGGYQDIIVQKDSVGNVQIFTRKPSSRERKEGRRPINIDDLAVVIRMVEQSIAGESISERVALTEESCHIGAASKWYYQKAGQTLLNGSKTTVNKDGKQTVQSTALDLVQIGKVVEIALGDVFPADRSGQCSSGNCTNDTNPCPFFKFGLARCRAIRGEQ